jgi:hypothetical protein
MEAPRRAFSRPLMAVDLGQAAWDIPSAAPAVCAAFGPLDSPRVHDIVTRLERATSAHAEHPGGAPVPCCLYLLLPNSSAAVTRSTACAGGALGTRPSSAAAQRGEAAGAPGQPAAALGTDPQAAGGAGRASAAGGPAVEAELAALRTALAEKQREVATGRADLERRQALLRSAAGARSRPGGCILRQWSCNCDTGHS